MEPMSFIRRRLLFWVILFTIGAIHPRAKAITYVSNLGNLWTEGGIGDVHGLFPGGNPYGTDTARFTTGSGPGFSLDAITIEFYPGTTSQPWNYVDVQLFQQTGSGSLLLGSLGNPVVNPTPTQWPGSTTFIDFLPLTSISLSALTQYSVVFSVPTSSPIAAALLFTRSSAYTTPANWVMGPTTTGNPYTSGERLVMAVNATAVPEPSVLGLLTLAGLFFGLRRSHG